MSKPTPEQMEHFYELQKKGMINRANLQAFLQNPNRFLAGFPVTYDQSLGLTALIERAVGPENVDNINRDITPERFPLAGTGVRTVNLRVERYLDNETSEQAAARLVSAGHKLASTGDLAGFLNDHPGEVEKWGWVLAISEDSRWAGPDGGVCVPFAFVYGANRYFRLRGFPDRLDSTCVILVSSESESGT